MKDTKTIEGRWWIFGPRKAANYGILEFDPEKGLSLSVKIAQVGRLKSALQSSSSKKRIVPRIVHGCDRHNNPITLFGCGPPSTKSALAFAEYKIRPFYCVIGGHWTAWDEVRTNSAQVEFTLLNNWIGRSGIHEEQGPGIYRPVSVAVPPDIRG